VEQECNRSSNRGPYPWTATVGPLNWHSQEQDSCWVQPRLQFSNQDLRNWWVHCCSKRDNQSLPTRL